MKLCGRGVFLAISLLIMVEVLEMIVTRPVGIELICSAEFNEYSVNEILNQWNRAIFSYRLMATIC